MIPDITPQIKYLEKITDKNGLIEHCHLDQPDYSEGYSVDDNARALQVSLRFSLKKLLPIYFHFLQSAFQYHQLYNDQNSDLSWENNFQINGEHYGRTLAALGETIVSSPKFAPDAINLFDQIYLSFSTKNSPFPRVSAQIISALRFYHSSDIKIWADSLLSFYSEHQSSNWFWFEDTITYDNARLPFALLTAYELTHYSPYLKVALESLDFLTSLTFDSKLNTFIFPGNKGWINSSNLTNHFAQQPIEAGSAVEAYSLAFRLTQNQKYLRLAHFAFDWYHGRNLLKLPLIDPQSGGIYDGLEANGPNKNQGAESILSYLLAYSSIKTLPDPDV